MKSGTACEKEERLIIQSLWAFFEDVKFLKGPAKIMRQFFAKTVHGSLEDTLKACRKINDELVLQASEMSFLSEKGHPVDQFVLVTGNYGYTHGRHFTKPRMTSEKGGMVRIHRCPRS